MLSGFPCAESRAEWLFEARGLANEDVVIHQDGDGWVAGVDVWSGWVRVRFTDAFEYVGVVECKFRSVSWVQRHHLFRRGSGSDTVYVLVRLAFGDSCEREAVSVLPMERGEFLDVYAYVMMAWWLDLVSGLER